MKDKNQLRLDLENARMDVDRALNNFTESVLALAEAGERREAAEVVKECLTREERQLKRLAGHLATQRYQGDFREAWIRIYERMERLCGYHPASHTQHTGQSHLDQCRKDGKVGQALKAARSLFSTI